MPKGHFTLQDIRIPKLLNFSNYPGSASFLGRRKKLTHLEPFLSYLGSYEFY
jgi:hypothetical protein